MKNENEINSKIDYYYIAYRQINIIFIILFLLIFSSALLIPVIKPNIRFSGCSELNSENCFSEGMTRAFTEIIKGNFENGKKINKYSLDIFLFLVIHLFLRISFFFLTAYKHKLLLFIYSDIVLSSLLFLFFFRKIFLFYCV
jgi:hypothetical protein